MRSHSIPFRSMSKQNQMNIVDRFFPTCRLHGARQLPPGARPTPHLPASSDPEGEERPREPIRFPLWERPKQRQVLKRSGVVAVFCSQMSVGVFMFYYSFFFPHIFLRSSETESDACKVNGRSEELLQTPGSSTSTDSSFGDGKHISGGIFYQPCIFIRSSF